MRRSLVAGVVLAFAAGVVVLVSSALDLGLESAALLDVAIGFFAGSLLPAERTDVVDAAPTELAEVAR